MFGKLLGKLWCVLVGYSLCCSASLGAETNAQQCFALYYGAGQGRDLVKARECFVAEVPKHACTEAFDLDRLYLAVMELDGQGGPADFPGARSLVADCEGERKAGILKAVRARETGTIVLAQGPGELDYCQSLAMTTLESESCGDMKSFVVNADIETAEKAILTGLDDKGRALYATWKADWSAFAGAEAEWAADDFRGGTGRGPYYLETLNGLNRNHLDDIRQLISVYQDPKDTTEALAASKQKLDAALAQKMSAADEQNRALLRKAEAAWEAYAAATPPLYCDVLPLQDCSPLTVDLDTRLNEYRLKQLTASAEKH